MLRASTLPGALLAVVSDLGDLGHAVRALGQGPWHEVLASGAMVAPDSGDPTEVVLHRAAARRRLRPQPERQGLGGAGRRGDDPGRRHHHPQHPGHPAALQAHGYWPTTWPFGQVALLQTVNRDDLRFAMRRRPPRWTASGGTCLGDPVTDPGKRSKAGRLCLLEKDGAFRTLREDSPELPALRAEG